MDLKDQLKALFPEHAVQEEVSKNATTEFWIQAEPLICKYEKRRGKPVTVIEGYTGVEKDFKVLTKKLKTLFGVGGSYKHESIIIQGDYRAEIMEALESYGFKTKRVGG